MHQVILLSALSFFLSLQATEIDSFTHRSASLKDSLEDLDRIMATNFEQALLEANQKQSCEPSVFKKALLSTVDGPLWSKYEDAIEHSHTLDRITDNRRDSIYRNIRLVEGVAFTLAKLGFILRVGDLQIGSDKFGHFLVTGYEYTKYDSIEAALAYGELTERTYYGLMTTGVYSYGDLAANLDGYLFWTHLVGQNEHSYVHCQDGVWEQHTRFSWADFVGPAWDEGINCSTFKEGHVRYSVLSEISRLGLSCPVASGHCENMIERYGTIASRVIYPGCFTEK